MRREAIALAAFLTAACAAATPAAGAAADARLSLDSGGLSASGPARVDLPAATLAGVPVTVEGPAGPFEVADTRPAALGWTLVASATAPVDALGRPLGGTLVLVPDRVSAGLAPGGGPAPLDAPRALMRAAPGAGLGTSSATPRLRLTIPADAPSGDYTAVLTITIS
ncbi:MAG: hypothetical protein AB7V42_02250 [Thermoleophilia bacterium]